MNIVNKPVVSKYLFGFYIGIFIFVAVMFGIVVLLTPIMFTIPAFGGLVILILVIFAYHIYMITKTEYRIEDNELRIRSFYGTKKIPLSEITETKKTLIPAGIKLFGSSFYAGYFYVPSLGKVFMAVTNYSDGILIIAGKNKFIISPSNPDEFIKQLGK